MATKQGVAGKLFRRLLFWSIAVEFYFGCTEGLFRVLGWCGIDFRNNPPTWIAIIVLCAMVANIPVSVHWTRWSIDFLRPEGLEAREKGVELEVVNG